MGENIFRTGEETPETSPQAAFSTAEDVENTEIHPFDPSEPLSADSPAKNGPQAVNAPPQVIKRGKGRPRADGMPNKTAVTAPADTPMPPFRKYWTENNTPGKPQALLDWVWGVPGWARARMTMYVERDWPMLIQITPEMKKAMKAAGKLPEHNYIAKLNTDEIFKKVGEFQDRFGAGDYHFRLVDTEASPARVLAEAWVREGWRDIRAYPPSDTRIDRVENIDLNEKSNTAYIQWLRSRGKLPEEGARGREDMAETSAVTQVLSFAKETMQKQQAQAPDTAKAVEVMADAAKRGFELITTSQGIADKQKAAAPDPLDNLTKMVDVVDKLRPPQQTDSGMMGMVLTQIMEMNKTIMGVQNERIASSEKRFDELKAMVTNRTAEANPAAAAAGVNPLEAGLGTFLKLAEMLGMKMPGRAAAAVTQESSVPAWLETLEGFATPLSNIVGNVVQAWTTSQYLAAAQRGIVMPPPQMMQPQPMQPQPQPQILQAHPQPDAPAGGEGEEDELENFTRFMGMIRRPLLNHINRGLGGAQFAEFLIDMTDEATYEQIKAQGADTFLMALESYKPIGDEIKGKDLVVKKFVQEFIEYNPDEMGESGDEEVPAGVMA